MRKPGFFAWYEWHYGIGRWKNSRPHDPAKRPAGLRKVIPLRWWLRAIKMQHGRKPKPAPKPKPQPAPKPKRITMYDSVTVAAIPSSARAVAGYVGGEWPTYKGLLKSHPHAKHLSIAVQATQNAMCLDVETGDATPAQAPAWVKRQHKRGIKVPVVYTSAAYVPALVDALSAAGLKHGRDYKLWCAHWTNKRHVCTAKQCGIPFNADATQYTNTALGRNLDASLCEPDFFP